MQCSAFHFCYRISKEYTYLIDSSCLLVYCDTRTRVLEGVDPSLFRRTASSFLCIFIVFYNYCIVFVSSLYFVILVFVFLLFLLNRKERLGIFMIHLLILQ